MAAIDRAHAGASVMVMPGKSRRNSTAAAYSPPSAYAWRIAVMVSSLTMTMDRPCACRGVMGKSFQ
jgi:hypothetical protein